MSEVERTLNIRHVSCACLGKINFIGGYQWSYIKHDKMYNLMQNEKRSNISRVINSEQYTN